MNVIEKIREWMTNSRWIKEAEKEFDIDITNIQVTNDFVDACGRAYNGMPDWADDEVKTINMAKTVCAELARLTTLNIGVDITGSARADYLKKTVDKIVPQLRRWVEYGCAYGEIILKPNGESIDLVFPWQYAVVDTFADEIRGIVFVDTYNNSADWYSRLEYHRIENGKYLISNRCYKGSKRNDFAKKVNIADTNWKGLAEDITAEGVDKMLFGVLKMPSVDNVNMTDDGLPMFADAMTELGDLDIAYSRFADELYDSKRTVLLDSDRLMVGGARIGSTNKAKVVEDAGLPKYVKLIEGTGNDDIYHEINPSLNTDTRLAGINALLSQIGFKCGFSNGYFVFNEKTGMVTATQVESDDRRTIQTIADIRKQLESCVDGLIYALDKFADAYKLAPRGKYETAYDMADLTENHQEDKLTWFGYVQQGLIPFWRYLTMYEGYAEDEAKKLAQEAKDEQFEMQKRLAGELYAGR